MGLFNSNTKIRDGPVLVVIGAYGGVGSALTMRLNKRHANVVLVGRDAEKLALLADQVDGAYGVVDATDFQALSQCIATV